VFDVGVQSIAEHCRRWRARGLLQEHHQWWSDEIAQWTGTFCFYSPLPSSRVMHFSWDLLMMSVWLVSFCTSVV